MERARFHQTRLNRILADVRLSPNRALLAEMLSMYFDAVAVDDRNMLRLLLFSVFGDPRHVRWLDGNDPPTPDTPTAGDTALTPAIKEVFAAMFNRGNKTDA